MLLTSEIYIFFTSLWAKREKRIFYIHHLTKEIWDIDMKFPFNKIGKCMETSLLHLNREEHAIIASESTKQGVKIDSCICTRTTDNEI